ncbi:MAG: class I SAM-dependent methyltransferase [Burkholderiales bacterium]|nr:class I SAM-dependent methyltransferase [Burkholderiales bacterium]
MTLPALARRKLRGTRDLVLDTWDSITGRRAPLVPPRRLRFVGDGDFGAIGREFVGHLQTLARLTPDARVLDVGCGIGRLAIPLLDVLSARGRYDGFDIVPRAIRWCRSAIAPRHPGFTFTLADLGNGAYRRRAPRSAATYRFPYPDASFDVVVAMSLFTHLLPDEARNYVREIGRVLTPGGHCLTTWFVRNAQSEALLEAGRSAIAFTAAHGECLVTDPAVPEAAIAYPQATIMAMHEGAGLDAVTLHPGAWCGRSRFTSGQDIVVASRPAADPSGVPRAVAGSQIARDNGTTVDVAR